MTSLTSSSPVVDGTRQGIENDSGVTQQTAVSEGGAVSERSEKQKQNSPLSASKLMETLIVSDLDRLLLFPCGKIDTDRCNSEQEVDDEENVYRYQSLVPAGASFDVSNDMENNILREGLQQQQQNLRRNTAINTFLSREPAPKKALEEANSINSASVKVAQHVGVQNGVPYVDDKNKAPIGSSSKTKESKKRNGKLKKKDRCVHFHYPPVTSMRLRPRTEIEDISALYFTEEEMKQIEEDRRSRLPGDAIEVVATMLESPRPNSSILGRFSRKDAFLAAKRVPGWKKPMGGSSPSLSVGQNGVVTRQQLKCSRSESPTRRIEASGATGNDFEPSMLSPASTTMIASLKPTLAFDVSKFLRRNVSSRVKETSDTPMSSVGMLSQNNESCKFRYDSKVISPLSLAYSASDTIASPTVSTIVASPGSVTDHAHSGDSVAASLDRSSLHYSRGVVSLLSQDSSTMLSPGSSTGCSLPFDSSYYSTEYKSADECFF
mmetsp:Transcript_5281/g.9286  ORF Transcript_5281/g.9286 Transcript_5281/m.9286 type:complete len:492 (-) Transcript_5281:501-1976(-)